jgi:hypothetical protein
MQLMNTPALNTISPARLPASTNPVSKNDLDTVISVADTPMHPEMTAISKMAGDFVLLAETTLALVGSDQKRQPEIDEKEASDLARLSLLKADTEQTLKGSAVHLDFSEGAMEMKLITLSIELSEIIDKLLKGRMQSQKERNELIEGLNDLLSELRKMEKSTDDFKTDALNKDYKAFPPGSPILRKVIEHARRVMEQSKNNAIRQDRIWLDEIVESLRTKSGLEIRSAVQWSLIKFPDDLTSDANGNILFWKKHEDGSWESHYIDTWGSTRNKLIRNYEIKEKAISDSKATFDGVSERIQTSGKASVSDLLYAYGVYKDDEKLPATKEDLEAATEKISSMVNSINSTQSLKMLDIHKFTNGRNEAYDLAVKINNTKFDSLNALIKMIGER